MAGFTFAEVLAALVFMAIVIPVALQGISVASRAASTKVGFRCSWAAWKSRNHWNRGRPSTLGDFLLYESDEEAEEAPD